MRFAVSSALKAIVISVLGCAAAILVACGDTNGLLPGDQASKLSSALDGVSAACKGGDVARAQAAATKFRSDVRRISAATVDRRLVAGLEQGAQTLEQLVAETCTEETVPTQTVVTPPPVTEATTPPVTTPTTPPQTTPTTPPDTSGGATTPTTPDTGGGTPTEPDTGGGTPPDTGGDTGEETPDPDANQGNPGGALAPGQGGTP